MWPPLPTRSTIAQCSSRRCKCANVRSANSRRRSPHPSNRQELHNRACPSAWLGQAPARGSEPLQTRASFQVARLFLDTFHTADTGSQFGTEQPSIGRLISQTPYSRESSVNSSRGELSVFKVNTVTCDHRLVKGESRFGAVPLHELINSVDSLVWTRATGSFRGQQTCCDLNREGRAWLSVF